MNEVTVPVKSGLLSKINWTQAVAFVASIAAVFGLDVSATTLTEIVVGIQAIQAVATVIIRQFFTKSVTASSVK